MQSKRGESLQRDTLTTDTFWLRQPEWMGFSQELYLSVYFDLLLSVFVYFPDEIVHLFHEFEVAESHFVGGHPEYIPHGCKRPEKHCQIKDKSSNQIVLSLRKNNKNILQTSSVWTFLSIIQMTYTYKKGRNVTLSQDAMLCSKTKIQHLCQRGQLYIQQHL